MLGRCRLQPAAGVLRCDDEVVPLPPKAVEVLNVLAARPGEVVSKNELMDAVWEGSAVEEANLTQCIYRLRRVLEIHEPIVTIETVPRRGYRLVFAQTSENAAATPQAQPQGIFRLPLRRGILVVVGLALLGLAAALFHPRGGNPASTQSFEAGYVLWQNARTTADIRKSLGYFEQAIRESPDDALGYAGSADAHLSLAARESGTPQETVDASAAMTAAKRAVVLDSSSGIAHAALGQAEAEDGDTSAAEQEFRQAIQLDPHNVPAHTWYGDLLLYHNRFPEAIAQFRAALTQNSPWTEAGDSLALLAYWGRDYADAAGLTQQALMQNPQDPFAGYVHALAIGERGQRAQAERELIALTSAGNPDTNLSGHALLSLYYWLDGNHVRALSEFAKTQQLVQRLGIVDNPSDLISIASLLAEMKQPDSAIAWLARVNPARRRLWVKDRRLDVLRNDPRFKIWLAYSNQ